MTHQIKSATEKFLTFSFDVGHSSIGWAVLGSGQKRPAIDDAQILGCGVVTFPVDDCLANQRRDFRRQRRHIRSTRLRIERMKRLLVHLGVMTREQLDKPGCAWPWLLAAQAFHGIRTLTWPELWDVLRWFAHNRGYDGNRAWSRFEEEEPEDTERVGQGRALLDQYKTQSMAEVFCHVLGINPNDPAAQKSSRNRIREVLQAAFPREAIKAEVAAILKNHEGKLPKCDEKLANALIDDWKALPCPAVKFPLRYIWGYLFGQLAPRFENRILTRCPFTNEKVPAKDCPEFYRYRWAMQLANVVVDDNGNKRPLTKAERQKVNARMVESGALTKSEFKKAVAEATGGLPDNLETMLMHPDAEKALVLMPARKAALSGKNKAIFHLLPSGLQARLLGKLIRRGSIRLREIRSWVENDSDLLAKFDAEIASWKPKATGKGEKNPDDDEPQDPLDRVWKAYPESGRAPFARPILQQAYEAVMAGKDPRMEGGVLYRSEDVLRRERERTLAEQTNNHLIRHRLLILQRLAKDMLKDYAGGKASRIAKTIIEVNSDLRTMSGMTAKERETETNKRLSNFASAKTALEKALADKTIGGKPIPITAGLIRKARLAMDLDMTCPYTGQNYDFIDVAKGRMQRDHVIPYADRASDSLAAQVLTFSEINKWKDKRTAAQFVLEEQGKAVKGKPNLVILPFEKYKAFVEGLDKGKHPHPDDKARKEKRKKLLMLEEYAEKEFLPSDLTITSQLVRLGARMLEQTFKDGKNIPKIISMPGSVTGRVQRAWSLMGCIAKANPAVLDETGKPKPKGDIRDISNLHHAVDACVLGIAGTVFPNDGSFWKAMVARSPAREEADQLLATGLYDRDSEKKIRLCDLPAPLKNQIADRLAECRVYQHIPADMTGLKADQNAWRVVDFQDTHPSARKLIRAIKSARLDAEIPNDAAFIVQWKRKEKSPKKPKKLLLETHAYYLAYDIVPKEKLIGFQHGKLSTQKAVKVVSDNFGLALDPEPQIIPFSQVWRQLAELRAANDGKPVRILRKGSLIRISQGKFAGEYKVFSIKKNHNGLSLDIGPRDAPRPLNKMTAHGHYINTLLSSLMKGGLEIMDTDYAMR
ncbi:MAG: type II CRISPR RNA-guided endonuclease Cas9 [Kiritimatiellia bacterium]